MGHLFLRKDYSFKILKNTCYIINSNQGTVVQLNQTGAFIWQKIKTPRSKKQIVKLVYKHYRVSLKTAEKDVEDFLRQGLKAKIIKKIKK